GSPCFFVLSPIITKRKRETVPLTNYILETTSYD
ncbi:MAG: hypothetical protein ACI83B_002488, partial [Sediminicola sp.]